MRSTSQLQNWILGIRLRMTSMVLGLAVALVPAVIARQSAQAQTLRVLHSFSSVPDGENPVAGLVRDASGNLYGSTVADGNGPGCACGTVFKLDTTGNKIVLHNFTGTGGDGAGPQDLIRDASGNLYGTAFYGGGLGDGIVFRVSGTGEETVLHSFTGTDGASPHGGLVQDAAGNLYGTTRNGGGGKCYISRGGRKFRLGCGTVFKLNMAGQETVLYSFGPGAHPRAGLVRDADGNLYGTTFGTVFKLDTTGKLSVLHLFTGSDGADPSGLIRDGLGTLYGTTSQGGTSNLGTVFKLDTTGKLTVLHSFTGGADGARPFAGLIRDPAGNLYGTTSGGGVTGMCGNAGCGVVFKLDTTGNETVLHSFGGPDGAYPVAGLIRDASGNFYGTTELGGTDGHGTVFELTP